MLSGTARRMLSTALLADEGGQGLVEYALIISLIALGVIGLLTQLGNKTSTTFSAATFNLP